MRRHSAASFNIFLNCARTQRKHLMWEDMLHVSFMVSLQAQLQRRQSWGANCWSSRNWRVWNWALSAWFVAFWILRPKRRFNLRRYPFLDKRVVQEYLELVLSVRNRSLTSQLEASLQEYLWLTASAKNAQYKAYWNFRAKMTRCFAPLACWLGSTSSAF